MSRAMCRYSVDWLLPVSLLSSPRLIADLASPSWAMARNWIQVSKTAGGSLESNTRWVGILTKEATVFFTSPL